MLERPPGGTTIRRPAGLMGMSSGVGGPGQTEKERKDKATYIEKEQEAHAAIGRMFKRRKKGLVRNEHEEIQQTGFYCHSFKFK